MSYGALLTDQNGVPFYIDGTRPLVLTNKLVFTPNYLSVYDLYPDDGTVRFTFLQSNSPFDSQACSWLAVENGMWRLYTAEATGATITAYIFGYAYQSLPSSGWGIAIFDQTGQCILTNETKVLKDIQALGDQSNDLTSGFRYNNTLNGSWAVAPYWSGLFSGVDNSTGQPRPVVTPFYLSARFNGAQTRLTSGRTGGIDGNISNPSYSNSRCLLTVVNVTNY